MSLKWRVSWNIGTWSTPKLPEENRDLYAIYNKQLTIETRTIHSGYFSFKRINSLSKTPGYSISFFSFLKTFFCNAMNYLTSLKIILQSQRFRILAWEASTWPSQNSLSKNCVCFLRSKNYKWEIAGVCAVASEGITER
jgi:hypothetical protein